MLHPEYLILSWDLNLNFLLSLHDKEREREREQLECLAEYSTELEEQTMFTNIKLFGLKFTK